MIIEILTSMENMRGNMESTITPQQLHDWNNYIRGVERTIKKQVDDYNHRINVSLYYTTDTKYDIIVSEIGDRFYKKDSATIRGLAGAVLRIYRTETTRANSILVDYDYNNLPNKEKEWVYTYESVNKRSHHLAHNGVMSEEGEFIINGKKTKGPGLFGDPTEDINCKCRVRLVDEP